MDLQLPNTYLPAGITSVILLGAKMIFSVSTL
jgi:hypothetical protein